MLSPSSPSLLIGSIIYCYHHHSEGVVDSSRRRRRGGGRDLFKEASMCEA